MEESHMDERIKVKNMFSEALEHKQVRGLQVCFLFVWLHLFMKKNCQYFPVPHYLFYYEVSSISYFCCRIYFYDSTMICESDLWIYAPPPPPPPSSIQSVAKRKAMPPPHRPFMPYLNLLKTWMKWQAPWIIFNF